MSLNVDNIKLYLEKNVESPNKEQQIGKQDKGSATTKTENRLSVKETDENTYVEVQEAHEENNGEIKAEESKDNSANTVSEITYDKEEKKETTGIGKVAFGEIVSRNNEIKKLITDFGVDEAFNIFDKDKNGEITENEIKKVNSSHSSLEDFTDAEIKNVLENEAPKKIENNPSENSSQTETKQIQGAEENISAQNNNEAKESTSVQNNKNEEENKEISKVDDLANKLKKVKGDDTDDNDISDLAKKVKTALEKRKENDKANTGSTTPNATTSTPSGQSQNTGSAGSTGSTGSVSGGGSGGSVGSYGGGGVGSSTGSSGGTSAGSSTSSTDTKKEVTLEELEKQKTEKEKEVDTANSDLQKVYSGENDKVKQAQEDYEKAEKDYKEKLEKDDKISEELKKRQKENLENIDKEQKTVDETNGKIKEKEGEITKQKSTIEADKSNLAALESALSSLPNPSDFKDNKDKQSEIESKKTELEGKIKEAKEKQEKDEASLKTMEEEKETLDKELKEHEESLKKYEEEQKKIEEEIQKNASDETKQALEAYNKAKENVETTKTNEAKTAQDNVDSKQNELNEINKQINELEAKKIEKENGVNNYKFDFEFALTDDQSSDLAQFKEHWEENHGKYEQVSEKLKQKGYDFPAELIASINWCESSGSFDTYLHNGEKLGQVTTLVPEGIYFENSEEGWMDAAIDALTTHSTPSDVNSNDPNTWFDYAEAYNGYGYRNHGVASAYVWSGTDKYTGGMYVADGEFDASAFDPRPGVAAMMRTIMENN